MKTANEALKIVTHEDAEQAKSIPSRVAGLNPGEELDPTKLMDLLGDIDGLKREIHERMRRIEAVKEAKSLLMEDALRTEALNKRLAEIGKVMNAVHSGFLVGSEGYEDPEVLRLLGRENPSASEFRATSGRSTDGVALAWPKAGESAEPQLSIVEAHFAHPDASLEMLVQECQPVAEAVVEVSPVEPILSLAEEPTENWTAPAESLAILEVQAPEEQLSEVEFEQEATVEAQPAMVNSQFAPEQMAEWEKRWNQANEAIAEARNLLEDAKARLDEAAAKEVHTAADLQASQQDLKLAFESASTRLEEAERFWKEADQTGTESKQRLEKSDLALAEARAREEAATTELQSARQELTTAYQFASVAAQRRLESAEFFERTARWTLFAAASAWIAMVWMGWIALVALHKNTTIVLPILGTVILLLLGMVLVKRRVKEPEDR